MHIHLDLFIFSEYPYLAFLLTTRTMPSRNYDHERNIIRIFLPRLARRINPMTYVPHLYSANCITMGDMQVIISQDKNVGTQAGAIMLLERIQCRQAPVVWYKKLLELMMADEQGDLVKEMEPDFYANSEQTGIYNALPCLLGSVSWLY